MICLNSLRVCCSNSISTDLNISVFLAIWGFVLDYRPNMPISVYCLVECTDGVLLTVHIFFLIDYFGLMILGMLVACLMLKSECILMLIGIYIYLIEQ